VDIEQDRRNTVVEHHHRLHGRRAGWDLQSPAEGRVFAAESGDFGQTGSNCGIRQHIRHAAHIRRIPHVLNRVVRGFAAAHAELGRSESQRDLVQGHVITRGNRDFGVQDRNIIAQERPISEILYRKGPNVTTERWNEIDIQGSCDTGRGMDTSGEGEPEKEQRKVPHDRRLYPIEAFATPPIFK